jgi:hypothetical protein
MSSIPTKRSTKRRPKNKRKQNRPKPMNPRTQQPGKFIPPHPKLLLSQCAKNYLHALINPYVAPKELPCVPDFIALPSYKLQTVIRGTMTVGVDGVGFVVYNPFTAVNSNNTIITSSTNYPLLYTGPTYALNYYNVLVTSGTLPTGVFGAGSNSPLSDTAPPLNLASVRLVGGAVRIRYSGTEFYRGGTVVSYRAQDAVNIPDGATTANLLISPLCIQESASRRWHSVNWIPSRATDLAYQPFAFYDPNQSSPQSYVLLIMVNSPGSTTASQTFDFEAVSYYEVIGNNLQLTPSHNDPVGYGAVQTAVATPRISEQTPESHEKSILTQIVNGASDGISQVAYNASKAFTGTLASMAVTEGAKMMLM